MQQSSCAAILVCMLSLPAPKMQGQQRTLVLEQRAGDAVANLIQQMRRQNKLPNLKRIDDPNLHQEACGRARSGATSSMTSFPVMLRNGAVTLSRISYSTLDAVSPPPELLSWAAKDRRRGPRQFAVGVCFVRTPEDFDGTYWVEVNWEIDFRIARDPLSTPCLS